MTSFSVAAPEAVSHLFPSWPPMGLEPEAPGPPCEHFGVCSQHEGWRRGGCGCTCSP